MGNGRSLTSKTTYHEFRENESLDSLRYWFSMHSNIGEWENGLTLKESDAVTDYTGNWYKNVNRHLYNEPYVMSRPPFDTTIWTEEQKIKILDELVGDLKSALSKFRLDEGIIVYRDAKDGHGYEELEKGDKVKFSAFSSCFVSSEFSTSRSIRFKIRIPKGKGRGAYIASLSDWDSENEFLLNANANCVVRRVYDEGKRRIIELDVK